MVALNSTCSWLDDCAEVIRENENDRGANHLYSVAALTDNTGAVVERYRYDAYGQRIVLAGDGVTLRWGSSYGNQVGFTGRYLDKETGLWYFRARYYSGSLGRFVSRDPLGYVDAYQLYNGHFIPNYLDPTGLVSWGKIFSGVAKVAGGLVSIAGGVAASGLGPGGAVLTVFLVVNGSFAIASGFSDFAMAFQEGEASFPASVPQAVATVLIANGAPPGATNGAAAVADLVLPTGGQQSGVRQLLYNTKDVVDHVKTINDQGVAIYNIHQNAQQGANPQSPQPGNSGEATLKLSGTATLTCRGKFSEHLVKSGDSLWKLWINRGDKSVSWADMINANQFLANIDKIHPGDYVCAIPCKK